jgi:hypothetical protein
MLDIMSTVGASWATRNLQTLTWFAPLLMLTGILGFVLPPALSLMSGATPYNVFHLLAGAVGLWLVLRSSVGGAVLFNLIFGGIDLYQALAGLTGWFPAELFGLQPADHAVHVSIGLLLLALGYLGKRSGSPLALR